MINKSLFFDEFDIKEHATTETLKRGKKAFQNNVIQNVSLNENSLQATYIRGKVEKKIKITKKDTKLIGTIDGKETKPFSAPLTALGYWYIDYINENKHFTQSENNNENTLEPFHDIQLTFLYDPNQNKSNITLYQPKNDTFCNESHLFIHSFQQLIHHFSSPTQTVIQKLAQRYDDIFYYYSHWEKTDVYISQIIIQLIQSNVLHNQHHKKITLMDNPIHLKITCKIINHQVLISFIWITRDNATEISVHDAMQCEKTHHIVYEDTCYKIENPMHSKIASQFKNHSFQRLNIIKIKPFIQKLVELRKKVGLELAIDANIQKLKKIDVEPICMIDTEPTKTGGSLNISYDYNNISIKKSNPTPYIIFDDFSYSERNFDMEHQYRDVLLHYHPISTEEDTIFYNSPHFDHILGAIKAKEINNIKLTPSCTKKITLSKDVIKAKIQFKTSGNSLKSSLQWTHPNKEKLTSKLYHHIQNNIQHYFDSKENKIIPIEDSKLITRLSKTDNLNIPIGVAIYLALNTTIDIELPDTLKPIIKTLKKTIPLDANSNKILRPFQKEGLHWLLQLYETNMNGILADDMGLGKTIQSIMLLNNVQTKHAPPSIIIMPKTLLFNWKKELETFAPKLNILIYDGPKRSQLIPTFKSHDIILSSYTSIRLDFKELSTTPFNIKILDEAQYIKNHTTNTFKAIKKIKTNHTLLLTGTPLENSISDLWSLMEIANPNYFGAHKPFETFYSDKMNQDLLKASLQPFMLRRRKKDVLKDLPSVTVQELWASPSPQEIQAYTKFASKEWAQIESIVQKKA